MRHRSHYLDHVGLDIHYVVQVVLEHVDLSATMPCLIQPAER